MTVAIQALLSPVAARAQAPAPPDQPQRAEEAPSERLFLTTGRSRVLITDFPITRIAITNPAIADATVVEPREVLIDGKSPGTVSLIIWGEDRRIQYDIVVQPGITALQQQFLTLFPGENIRVNVTDEAMILSGQVSSNIVMLRAGEIAQASASKLRVINLLQLPGGIETQQVMLQVRVAEVNRRALEELGIGLFTGATGYKGYIARGTTQQFPAPEFTDLSRSEVAGDVVSASGQITFSDFLNLFLFDINRNIGAVIKALQTRGNFQSLAEPNLIAYNGQVATFLAGGEIPVPVVQGISGAVGIQWKEFGVRLNFRPTIAGDTIRLHVNPEVSSLDFANGITLGGFRVPALSSRRAETDIELRDGQSFAIAGLLNNQAQADRTAIPVLSSIPIIGNLFKSKAQRSERTELMVLVTPRLVRPLDPDEVPPLPTLPGRFLPPEEGIGGQLEGGGGVVDAPAPGTEQKPAKPPIEKR